jgi:hypothetical protein
LAEHLLCKERVRSSSLLVSTNPLQIDQAEEEILRKAAPHLN